MNPLFSIRRLRSSKTINVVRNGVFAVALLITSTTVGASIEAHATPTDWDWLGVLNAYRSMSGLKSVAHNGEWDQGTARHSCYILDNGLAHDEIEGLAGYTTDGDVAGNSGNVASSGSVSSPARIFVELWLTGPFHAVGLLRPNLESTSYGECRRDETPTVWKSAATLDVIRGVEWSAPRPAEPTLFPGRGSTVPLYRFITETPNPVEMCGWDTASEAGLPLIAMMPNKVTRASTSLTGPNGPIGTCTLHSKNTEGTAASVLDGDNAVVVMPDSQLEDGIYTATVQSDGGDVTWSFNIDREAKLPLAKAQTNQGTLVDEPSPLRVEFSKQASRLQPVTPYRHVDTRTAKGATRLLGGASQQVRLAAPDVAAVSANITAVDATDAGFLTIYDCREGVPNVSALNYGPGETKANHATIPLYDGKACFYSRSDVDVLVDINGYYVPTDDAERSTRSGLRAVTPIRLVDTRTETGPLRAGEIRRIDIAPSAAPEAATAVSLNITAVSPTDNGYISAFPCGQQGDISTVNYTSGGVQPNSAVVPLDDRGDVCVMTLVDTHLLVGYNGYFTADTTSGFMPIQPIRILDTRETGVLNPFTGGVRADGGTIIKLPLIGSASHLPGGLAIPTGTDAVSLNVTAADPAGATFVTAYPCDQPLPNSSNVNIDAHQLASSNGALTKLSATGELCVYTLNSAHIVIDINGLWLE